LNIPDDGEQAMTVRKNITPPDPSKLADPRHWRDKAEEARCKAEEMSDCIARETMERVADDYERLAKQAEGHTGA
jgi:hypothetical protein